MVIIVRRVELIVAARILTNTIDRFRLLSPFVENGYDDVISDFFLLTPATERALVQLVVVPDLAHGLSIVGPRCCIVY